MGGGSDAVSSLGLLAFAGWVVFRGGRRVTAFVLDLLLVLGLSLLAHAVFETPELGFGWLAPYRILAHSLCGRTLGKKALGLKVVNLAGDSPTLWQVAKREAWIVIVALWPFALAPIPVGAALGIFLVVGLMSIAAWLVSDASVMANTNGKRSLHDYIGGTSVEGPHFANV